MICFHSSLRAQSPTQQLWLEYMLNYPFAKSFNLENAFVYSTLLTSPRWYSLEYTPTVEYALNSHFDILSATTFSYTHQSEDYNTFEIRPMVGTKIHFTPHRRVLLRLLLRAELRNIKNLDTDQWQTTFRPRIRAESLIPINKKSFSEDKLWYGIADAEWFFTIDDVDERFANRFRLRLGLGYRLSYTSRFEFIYTIQQSKNTIEDDYHTADNIWRLRYKHYLRKHKPTKSSGTGN
jgi:hypothetical protein